MYDTNPFSHKYMYSPLCKRKYTDIQAEDVAAETNQLIIRSPGSNDLQSYPFKRIKEDNYPNFLSTDSSSPLAHMDFRQYLTGQTFSNYH
ncbi:unnamed protein product [Absidia cylindrospora]